MNYIPIMLNVSGRSIVIVGGGEAAYKKTKNLIAHCSDIKVIAEEFDQRFSEFKVLKINRHLRNPDEISEFINGTSVVVIATDDPTLNASLENYCVERGILYNRVDDGNSPFIFPASFEKNGVVVSVSTLGKSPSLTRFIRDLLQENVGSYTLALPVLERLRRETKMTDLKDRAEYFRAVLLDEKFWEKIRNHQDEEAYSYALLKLEKSE